MLLSESKERENRFKLALKIGFPFLIIIFVFILLRYDNLSNDDVILLTILSIIYTYYIFYLIYSGFKSTLIDPITKTFNYFYIINLMEKISKTKTNNKYLSIMISVSNIADINERYSLKFGDEILKNFVKALDNYLIKNNYKNTPIGRYGGGYFLLFVTGKEKEMSHILRTFESKMKDSERLGCELKIDFSILPFDYDEKKENIILQLLEFLKVSKEEVLSIKPDIFNEIVCNGIQNGDIIFKYQSIENPISKKNELFEILTKLKSKDYGDLSYGQIISVVHRNGKELDFDKAIIKKLLEKIKFYFNTDKIFLVQLSTVSLRSQKFKNFVKNLIEKNELNPKNIIIQISEKKSYLEMKRFKEILEDYNKMGLNFCLNHFGGNNASLEYLKILPIDYVSFDIEYTKNMNNEKHNKILKAYIKLLKDLHVKSIIKFIDKKEIYNLSNDFGIDFIQGHYISKPKKLEDL